ncbi:leaf rust 10 disease-resistance locus receptor-like protein kinase-like 1.2 protein, partial [Tanacetum coccineum]
MDIEYNKKKFRVQNTAVPTKNCQKLENLDIRNFTIGSQFSIVNHTNQNLVLMSNCSGNSLDPGMDIYRVGSIGSCEKNTTEYAMLKADTNMKNMTRRCGVVVETPVEVSGGEGWRVDGTNYGEVMERGFEMTWRAQDCGECAKSGGRCGYNATAREPICFCSDRPHRLSCNPRRNIAWVILLKALGVGAATIVLVIILYLKRKPGWRKKAKNDVNVEIFLKNQKFLAPK